MQLKFRHTRAPDEVGGIKIPYLKARRGAHRLGWYAILLLVLSPVLYLGTRGLAALFSHTANGTVDLGQQEIRASEAGAVRELEVNVGERVVAGEALAVLDSIGLDAELARNSAQLDAAAQGARGADAQRAPIEQQLALEERTLQYERRRRAAIEDLFNRGAATLAELDEATAAAAAAEASVLASRRDLAVQPSLAPPPEVMRAERAVLGRRRKALTASAPFNGRTLAVLVRPGEYVSAGEPLLVLARLDQPRIVSYVPPAYATHLHLGAPATVYFPDGTRLRASIAATPEVTTRMPADLVDQFGLRPMTVVLDLLPEERWPQAELVQGLPVTVRFESRWESSAWGAWVGTAIGHLPTR